MTTKRHAIGRRELKRWLSDSHVLTGICQCSVTKYYTSHISAATSQNKSLIPQGALSQPEFWIEIEKGLSPNFRLFLPNLWCRSLDCALFYVKSFSLDPNIAIPFSRTSQVPFALVHRSKAQTSITNQGTCTVSVLAKRLWSGAVKMSI